MPLTVMVRAATSGEREAMLMCSKPSKTIFS